jgi:membrane protein
MFTQKFTDYVALIFIAPVLLVVTSSFTVSLLPSISNSVPFLQKFDIVLTILATILSYVIIWFVFTFIFIIIPNTKVKFVPALVAGIIAGTLFQLLQWGYITFQSILTGYSAVYGTFAALPLFMVWLEISWWIVLLGAEISFAYQNRQNYEQEAEGIDVSIKQKRLLVLLVSHSIVKNFVEGKPPLKADEIAKIHGVPVRLVQDVIYDLQECRIINEIIASNIKDVAYQPALDPALITVGYVIDKFDQLGHHSRLIITTKEMNDLSIIVESFYNDLQKSPSNILLKEI